MTSAGNGELDIGVDGGVQHSLDPGKLVAMRRWILGIAIGLRASLLVESAFTLCV